MTGSVRALGQATDGVVDRLLQLGAGVAEIGDLEVRGSQLQQHLQRQRLLRRPVAVDRRLADAGRRRHMFQSQVGEPVGGDRLTRRIEDGALSLAAPWSAWTADGLVRCFVRVNSRRPVLIRSIALL